MEEPKISTWRSTMRNLRRPSKYVRSPAVLRMPLGSLSKTDSSNARTLAKGPPVAVMTVLITSAARLKRVSLSLTLERRMMIPCS
jgi:hypothetical protein